MAEKSGLRQREHERLDRLRTAPKMKMPFETKVVSVTMMPSYPTNLDSLRVAWEEASESGEPLAAVLVRNPANEYDTNAIQVHVPSLGDPAGFIGHLTSPLARRLAPQMDSGEHWGASVEAVLIHPDHPSRPGISIRCFPAPEAQ